ncbi:LLM class flavin-dependent oxidoreductase [Actinoplanes sp. M2I2]|uniref:LLM class flavin-dependent oxidoreductase n=1 Tax=Actinoplanes sp. M2I2 TaxID=1734444 RepID=UPI0027E11036|nr:LLM class flavin-dependent oxidoreductase [Actinoplanes sp. M2I2]
MEFGLDTFGDVTVDEQGKKLPYAEVIRNVVEQAVLAERVGVDGFGLGEHHRDDFAVSSPEIVLAAIAARTERIKLGTAVTVLSSDDPVRVFERFATLDAVSHGRAEIILGRGSFTESFPLFGYDLHDYERLFEEKADLMVKLLGEGPVSWEGTVRPALKEQQVYPKTESGHIRTWIGVGGSPESVVRAARHGLPLVWPSSAASRPASRPMSTSITALSRSSSSPRSRSPCTAPASWPRPTRRRSRRCGRTRGTCSTGSGASGAGRR